MNICISECLCTISWILALFYYNLQMQNQVDSETRPPITPTAAIYTSLLSSTTSSSSSSPSTSSLSDGSSEKEAIDESAEIALTETPDSSPSKDEAEGVDASSANMISHLRLKKTAQGSTFTKLSLTGLFD